jgi:uncharacterized membrane protein
MFRSIRSWFISGLLILSPVAVTVFVVNFLIARIGAPASNVLFGALRIDAQTKFYLEFALNVASLVLVLFFVTILGRLSQLFIGRYLITTFERIVDNVPVVRTVYNTVKQIRDTFVQQQKAVFQRTVLIEYPRAGVWALGFLTGESKGEPQAKTESDLLNIFLPTTPNPTSGFLLMVPRDQVRFLDMTVGEGMKLIISGGAVAPVWPPAPKPPSQLREEDRLPIEKGAEAESPSSKA